MPSTARWKITSWPLKTCWARPRRQTPRWTPSRPTRPVPPFDVAGLVSANRLLISTGQSAEEARQVINALGNAVSASGGGNAELERMAANLQQIANVGKASAVDIRQFAYAGIDIYGILADYTGLAKDEVQDLTISYDLLTDALKAASAEGGRYAGAMEAYSQTLQGQMDTLADNATQTLGLVTEGIHNALIPIVEDLSNTLDAFTSSVDWDAWSLQVQGGRHWGLQRHQDPDRLFAAKRPEGHLPDHRCGNRICHMESGFHRYPGPSVP